MVIVRKGMHMKKVSTLFAAIAVGVFGLAAQADDGQTGIQVMPDLHVAAGETLYLEPGTYVVGALLVESGGRITAAGVVDVWLHSVAQDVNGGLIPAAALGNQSVESHGAFRHVCGDSGGEEAVRLLVDQVRLEGGIESLQPGLETVAEYQACRDVRLPVRINDAPFASPQRNMMVKLLALD